MEWALRSAEPADVEAIAELRATVMRPDLERLGRFDEHRVRQRLRDSVPGLGTGLGYAARRTSPGSPRLRRTFIGELLGGGADLATAQALAGHVSGIWRKAILTGAQASTERPVLAARAAKYPSGN